MAQATFSEMEERKDPYAGRIWSVHPDTEECHSKERKRKSRGTIIVCSIVLLAVTAALTTWVFVVRPTFYPKLKIMSRGLDPRSELESGTRHHISKRSGEIDSEADVRSKLRRKETGNKSRKRVLKSKLKDVYQTVKKEDFPYNSSRLSRDLIPRDYFIKLDVDLSKDTYSGDVTIDVKCEKTTKQFIFHGRRLNLKHVDAESFAEKEKVKISRVLFYPKYEMYLVEVDDYLREGHEYSFFIEFETKYNENLAGFYKSQYRTKEGEFR